MKPSTGIPTHLAIMLGGVISVMILGLLIHTAIGEQDRMIRLQEAIRARNIEAGADLFGLHCRNCHGARGEGVGQLGPALNDQKFFTTRIGEVGWQDTLESYVYAATAQGRLMATRPMYAGDGKTAVMAPWLESYGGPLRADQIRNLAAFILNWKATALGEVVLTELTVPKTRLDDPRVIDRGKRVFRDHCGQCHSIQGLHQAGKKGPDLTDIAQTASTRKTDLPAEDYIRESFLLPDAFIVEGFDPQKLGYRCGGVLSVTQLDEVTAFLISQKKQ